MRPLRHWSRASLQLGLPLLLLGFCALVWLSQSSLRGARLDLTEKQLYTLSPGTLRILARVPEPVKLKLYWSRDAAEREPQFRLFAQRVQELLEEVSARSNGKVTLEIVDPEPFSDAEDQANEHGLTALPLGNSGDSLYFGLVGSNRAGAESVMPLVDPRKEAFLEYDLARMITTLGSPAKPVLAMLSDLPTGEGFDPLSGNVRPAWVLDRKLAEVFELRRLSPDPVAIGDDVKVLMLVHPKALSADAQYAIDQFVLRGGHLLVFVDPDAESDPAGANFNPTQPSLTRGSDLPILFAAWGLQYDPGKVVLDRSHSLRVEAIPGAAPVENIALLELRQESMNQKDVVTAELETIDVSSVGALALQADSPLRLEPLLQSSGNSALADTATVRAAGSDPAVLLPGFKPDGGGPYVLAGRLHGNLKSAFPQRHDARHLAASLRPANIIVVADTDLLTDRLWVQKDEFLGQPLYSPFANNADFVYNAVDNLSGDDDLIQVRTRPTSQRPFERIDAVRRVADTRYQARAQELQQHLDELEQKLSQLLSTSAGEQPRALTPQQRAQLREFQREKLRTRKELRAVQHQLNADIERIGSNIKLLDIFAMPLLVLLATVVIALRRYWRRQGAER